MVWGLFSSDPSSGEDKYYIFAKGTYKVGRKGCDVIINKDRGVSRIHAEIIVDAMTSLNHPKNKSGTISSEVLIRDCSKYGTFINKDGLNEKVHEIPNKETTLKEGDLVSFGTGNATYRFCFVPLVFFVHYSEAFQRNNYFEDKVLSMGARITHHLSQECTHVLVDPLTTVREDLIDAVLAKKPFVLNSWVEHVAEKYILNEIPSCNSYMPTLTVEGVSVKVADPKARENCLEGYTFVLESKHAYKYGKRLESLLEMGGAKILSLEGFCSASQGSQYGELNRVACVIPRGSADKFDRLNKLSSLSRVNEIDLIRAVLTGHLDPSTLISPPVQVSSSCSTDETVVADSDAEAETATSIHATASAHIEEPTKNSNEDLSMKTKEATTCVNQAEIFMHNRDREAIVHTSKEEIFINHDATRSYDSHVTSFRDGTGVLTATKQKIDESEFGNSDIIYTQDLILKPINFPSMIRSPANNNVLNFKRFRKANTQSGNSFTNLIPFARYPYKDSDYGNEEMAESLKEERKRKQMEAIAEDLFNNEKGKRRGSAGSLCGLLSRG